VFLNACQVGAGADQLHQYSGLASAFLSAGASGVIAPLWSVKDDIAHRIAVGFYDATIGDGLMVGEAIRKEREAFAGGDAEPESATFMAYQYFGHPCLRLARSDNGGNDER
jgi:CHAT domain-containing protein